MYCAIVKHQAFKMQKKDDAAPSYSTGKKCNFLMDKKNKTKSFSHFTSDNQPVSK